LRCAADILFIQFHDALQHPGVRTVGGHHLPDSAPIGQAVGWVTPISLQRTTEEMPLDELGLISRLLLVLRRRL
jgi:hypothetical protein